jgi:NAD(P)-dependent dehydrogenase (short-subunit alcohol dehydrogenase family)
VLEDRIAIVTGASRGIGLAIAEALEQAGAHVVRLARTVARPSGAHPAGIDRRIDIKCDVTLESDVARAAETVLETVGPPDILVNNAGAFLLKPLADTTAEEFRTQLDVNVLGGFLVLKAFVPAMAERGGHVITIGSVADYMGFPGNSAYGASKYALRGLHDALRAEYAGTGIRMTLVSPGPTDTAAWDPVDPDRREDLPDRAGMLRPEDVADVVLFAVTRSARTNIELIRLMPA